MEIEVKILNIDVEKIKQKLESLGGEIVKKENQTNKLFDFEDGRLLKQEGYGRIRIIEDLLNNKHKYFMTVKKRVDKHKDFKVMEENEVIIDNPKEGEMIFQSIGMHKTYEIKKYRESYKLDGVLVEIDINDKKFYPHPYIEIEGDTYEDIKRVVHKLGYKMEDTTSKGIFDIIREGERN